MRKVRHWVSAAVLLLVLPVLLLVCAFGLPSQYGLVYHAALGDKAALLRDTPSPRIVVIGGSGAAFDVDSALLEQQFPGYAAVNFGLYAGLGTSVMLELAEPDLRPGDTVIFMPELSAQTLSDWFDAEMMWQAAEEDPGLLRRLDASRRRALLAAFPRYAAQKASFFFRGNAPAGDGVYARSSFDARGDILADLRPANRMPGGWDVNAPVDLSGLAMTEDIVRCVDRFAGRCEERGIRFFFRFCPVDRAAVTAGDADTLARFEAAVRRDLECEVIGSLPRAVMDPGWFFDTNFHLNAAGAVMNTILLAEDLKAALGNPASVDIPVPAMPGTPDEENARGDDSDADMFLYAEEGDGLTVTGLTDAGRMRAALTLPSRAQGKPVLTLSRHALAQGDALETLTIQESLRTIQDGAFADCPRLRTIVLQQPDPGKCTVGPGLLEGTSAEIVVLAERYGSYCTNYFWSVHAARLRPSAQAHAATATPRSTPAATARPKALTRLTYHGNGGITWGQEEQISRNLTYAHLRENTLQGTVWFHRDGYTLTGWNTRPDGSGTAVGLGSRYGFSDGEDLYAQWLPWSADADFTWSVSGSGAAVTGYRGSGGTCVIPEEHEGLPVRSISAGAFRGAGLELLVLPPSLRSVEDGAFDGCGFDTLLLYDSLERIGDGAFSDCRLRTLRVNAAVSPAYSGSYFDTFQDKLDLLRALRGWRKLVLSSGSSGRYGYDSGLLAAAYPELSPVNMGVYAYTNALPQLALILPLMEEGDVLLYAPEFDAIREQFCVVSRLDTGFWAMMESDYDAVSRLNISGFSGIFDSFGEYQRIRSGMPKRGYEVSPANFDDDGNYYVFSTYNSYGDFILPRPNGDTDERLRHNIADYTLDSFPEGTVASLNAALRPFREKGIDVYFSYTPRNSASLTEQSTPEARAALEGYLRQTVEAPVISRLEDSLMPGRYFWLIDSHLGTEGARLRTEQVIRDLAKVLHTEQGGTQP